MEKKVTSAQEFRQLYRTTKEVELPVSKAVFLIRKVTSRDYIENDIIIEGLPILSVNDITQENIVEKAQILWSKMTHDQKKKQITDAKKIMTIAVVEPKLSLIEEENKVCVDELDDDDFNALMAAINEFSFGGKNLKFFRKEQDTAGAGRNSEEVRSQTVSDNGTESGEHREPAS